jgi:hypothetical protein
LLFLATAAFTSSASRAASPKFDLDPWVERELAPFVAAQLTEHPRFKGETVMFVVLEDGNPAPKTNALALALRDRLLEAVVNTPGVAIGWQPEHRESSLKAAGAGIDCTRDEVHYYIGVEVARLINGRHRVMIRALDLEDQSWVSGFGTSWEGALTGAQRRAFQQTETDQYFLGVREVPYSLAQMDLLAAHLAHQLSCALLQGTGDYIVVAAGEKTQATSLDGTVELVSNNLASYQALQVTAQADRANAVLQGKAHQIDAELYQYWITVTPRDGAGELPPVSASAYIDLPARRVVETTAPAVATRVQPAQTQPVRPPPVKPVAMPFPDLGRTGNAVVLSPLQIVESRDLRSCHTTGPAQRARTLVGADYTVKRGHCFALQARANSDAVVFFLNHQLNNGLVRLSGQGCGTRTQVRVVRAGEQLRFPGHADAWQSTSAWQGQAGSETYYAVAVTHTQAARELTRQVDRVPARCSAAATAGLDGPELQDWLAGFTAAVDRWQPYIDWQAVRVRHVY